ncbi:hemerythrin domain-containing protein [Lysobacter maris]|uniref:Hemerythrin domain-containing protein n=2 Tax=Marilutibacter maris TaxID=1605891 RepID=A0A508AEQ9_9GAMM|nr:hemerythrin domain-containing protein [Lysobacter maris]
MLGFMRRLVGQPQQRRAPKGTAAVEQAATLGTMSTPARPIAYDAGLVPALKQDHNDLVALFDEIGSCARHDRFEEIPPLLTRFKMNLEAHLIAENVRFYNYVERALEGDSENTMLIRSFRREMNAIARGVVDFVKKYQLNAFDEASKSAFIDDYQAVGDLLAQRIQREEASLYPLYQPA